MNLRSALGSLQLPVGGLGLLVVAVSLAQLHAIPEPPPGSDGFVEGLATFFLGLLALGGFVVSALGFAIPPGEGYGVRFGRWQRRLFVAAAVGGLVSLLVPLFAWSVVAATGVGPGVVVLAWLGTLALAVLSFVGTLGWRIAEAVARRVGA